MLKNLFIAAALAAGASVSAAPFLPRVSAPLSSNFNKAEIIAPQSAEPKQASRAESVTLGYCGSPFTAYNLNNTSAGDRIVQLVEVPVTVTSNIAGTEISAVNLTNPSNSSYRNTMGDVTVVIYTDLNAEPVYTQAAKLGTSGFQTTKVTLAAPYIIKGDTPVYFGYEFSYKTSYSSLYYVITDGNAYAAGLDYIGVGKSTGAIQFSSATDMNLDGNLCITADATLNGEVVDLVSLTGITTNPTAEAGTPFPVELGVLNLSTTPLESIDFTCEIGGVDTLITYAFASPVEFMQSETIEFEPITDVSGAGVAVTVKGNAINGKAVELNTVSATIDIVVAGMGVKRTVVVEEGTGTWCGWCPMGYVMLEDSRDRYENYIGIAVHNGDAMAASSYDGFISNYISGFPEYYVNRLVRGQFVSSADYNQQVMDSYYNVISSWVAIASLDFEATVNSETDEVVIDASTTFGFSGKGDYRLAVVLKEDSVGPYRQTNNLYGTQGWGVFTTTAKPSLLYNDVARNIKTWNGITGSVPSEFESGVAYKYQTSISAAAVKGAECDVVLMLINGTNGSIEQAVSKHVVVKPEAGLDEINAAGSDAVEYFDLNGRRLAAPGRGVVIERSANGSRKVIF